MWQLVVVSLIWALSFGLIKGQLTGISPPVVASIRLFMCFICFVPFLFFAKSTRPNLKLIGLGSIQFGLMYLLYIQSYQYLPGYLVAVFTIFTPFYVILINSVFCKTFYPKQLLPILLSVLGALVIVYRPGIEASYFIGFILLQMANIAFAAGQVGYRYLSGSTPDRENMVWMYLGAVGLAGSYSLITTDLSTLSITPHQWLVLLYLGVVSSGLCFYLWNKGAKLVSSQTLAVMNNAYVPVAVIFSILIFGEQADMVRLTIGGSLIALSVFLAKKIKH